MKVFILTFSDCWTEGFDIIGVFEDRRLAEHARDRIIKDDASYTKKYFEIIEEVVQVW